MPEPQVAVSLFDAEELLVAGKVTSFNGDQYTIEVEQPGLRATFTVSDNAAHDAWYAAHNIEEEGSAYDAFSLGSTVWLKLR